MSDAADRDYYTHDEVGRLWAKEWKTMARNGTWFSQTEPGSVRIDPMYDCYFPFGCNVCKLCELTGTSLSKCSNCKVIMYCGPEHQRMDWKANHKQWCKAYCACRERAGPSPTDYNSWKAWSFRLLSLMGRQTDVPNHSTVRQYAAMQPRCRKCFAAASDGATLITCPECCGVALCKKCHEESDKDTAAFHLGSEYPENECEQHFLSLTCLALVIEQGWPLTIPCDTDCDEPWFPKDWYEYFERKRSDFGNSVPVVVMWLPPVICFITDGLSSPLTMHHCLNQIQYSIEDKLVIHIVGASSADILSTPKYVELVRLNPQIKELKVVLIGPAMTAYNDLSVPMHSNEVAVRSTCKTLLSAREGLYHKLAPTLEEKPNVIYCPHCGITEPSYTASWQPTIDYIRKELPSVPVILTGYTHQEVVDDTLFVQQRIGMHVVVEPTPNPFRGLRPFSDPFREGRDFHYSNASYSIVRGASLAK